VCVGAQARSRAIAVDQILQLIQHQDQGSAQGSHQGERLQRGHRTVFAERRGRAHAVALPARFAARRVAAWPGSGSRATVFADQGCHERLGVGWVNSVDARQERGDVSGRVAAEQLARPLAGLVRMVLQHPASELLTNLGLAHPLDHFEATLSQDAHAQAVDAGVWIAHAGEDPSNSAFDNHP
jgi:hypothetical protein